MKEHQVFSHIAKALFASSHSGAIFAIGEQTPLTVSSFHSLPSSKEGRVLYVDGGQGVLLCSAAQVVGIVRVASVCYAPKRMSHTRATFVVTIRMENEFFKITYVPLEASFDPKPLPAISLYAHEFLDQAKRVHPMRLLALARRCLEFQLATQATDVHMVVLDGSLEVFNEVEKEAMAQLKKMCTQHSILLSGVSKTTQTLTSVGTPLTYELTRMQPSQQWWYGPFERFSIAKLSAQSSFCFRIDGTDVPRSLSLLLPVCADPVFLGYPYGLIEADNLARVTEQETQQAKVLLQMMLSREGVDMQALESSTSAHGILDSIRF